MHAEFKMLASCPHSEDCSLRCIDQIWHMLAHDAVTRVVEKDWASPRRKKSQVLRRIRQDKLKCQVAPKPLELRASKVYFSLTCALWVTPWFCPVFSNQDPCRWRSMSMTGGRKNRSWQFTHWLLILLLGKDTQCWHFIRQSKSHGQASHHHGREIQFPSRRSSDHFWTVI